MSMFFIFTMLVVLTSSNLCTARDTKNQHRVIHFAELVHNKNAHDIKKLFDKEIKQNGITVVKFSAEWCGPCKRYAPIFEETARELHKVIRDGKKVPVKFISVDIDTYERLAQEYNITSVPTTLIFLNGKKIVTRTGCLSKETLINLIG